MVHQARDRREESFAKVNVSAAPAVFAPCKHASTCLGILW
jgi:hypothetical protein